LSIIACPVVNFAKNFTSGYNWTMRFIKKNWQKVVFISYATFLMPAISRASVPASCDPTKGMICNPLTKADTIEGFIKTLLEGLLKVGIPLVALAIIYCGFLFVSARGNSEKLKKAKDALLYTLIGAAILLGSWAIARLISDTVLSL